MKDNEILKMLGLDDRTITIGLDDEYTQMILEKKIDSYLKKVDEENKKEKMISYLKEEHEKYIEKEKIFKYF